MLQNRTVISCLLLVAALLLVIGVSAQSPTWLKGSTEQQLKALADIQPGLGTVMIEYGNRYTTAYYAAKGGNWQWAAYQVKEAREIQEVGETTRPSRAPGLKKFESTFLDPIDAAIKAKDFKKFDAAFKSGIAGCNGCHVKEGFPYIKYQLPDRSPSPISNTP
jgi:hypothetical protein